MPGIRRMAELLEVDRRWRQEAGYGPEPATQRMTTLCPQRLAPLGQHPSALAFWLSMVFCRLLTMCNLRGSIAQSGACGPRCGACAAPNVFAPVGIGAVPAVSQRQRCAHNAPFASAIDQGARRTAPCGARFGIHGSSAQPAGRGVAPGLGHAHRAHRHPAALRREPAPHPAPASPTASRAFFAGLGVTAPDPEQHGHRADRPVVRRPGLISTRRHWR